MMHPRHVQADIRKALVESRRRAQARKELKRTRGNAPRAAIKKGWLSDRAIKPKKPGKLDAVAAVDELLLEFVARPEAKRRGRPKGSKNKPKEGIEGVPAAPSWSKLKTTSGMRARSGPKARARSAVASSSDVKSHARTEPTASIDIQFKNLLRTLLSERAAALPMGVIEALGAAFGHRMQIAFLKD